MAATPTIRLADLLAGRANNFDLMRLLAAAAVMFGHSFWIQPAAARVEPILAFTGMEYSGSLAVYTFFLISGMLVTASFERQRSAARFVALRVTRIWPGLVACAIVTALVVYPLSTDRSLGEILGDNAVAKFVVSSMTMLTGIDRALPGAFTDNAIPTVMNGSLWTLPVEVKCYGVVLLCGILGIVRSRIALAIASAELAFGLFLIVGRHLGPVARDLIHAPLGYGSYPVLFYLLGMCLYAARDIILIDLRAAVALVCLYFLTRDTVIGPATFYISFAYAVLAISAVPALHRFAPKHDLSYGVYLWAFPIQQLVAMRFPHMDNLISLLLSVPATAVVAAASWFIVERPAIRWVRGFGSHRSAQAVSTVGVVPK